MRAIKSAVRAFFSLLTVSQSVTPLMLVPNHRLGARIIPISITFSQKAGKASAAAEAAVEEDSRFQSTDTRQSSLVRISPAAFSSRAPILSLFSIYFLLTPTLFSNQMITPRPPSASSSSLLDGWWSWSLRGGGPYFLSANDVVTI